jgi:hypothetical protein
VAGVGVRQAIGLIKDNQDDLHRTRKRRVACSHADQSIRKRNQKQDKRQSLKATKAGKARHRAATISQVESNDDAR